jgi:hypothetical protein
MKRVVNPHDEIKGSNPSPGAFDNYGTDSIGLKLSY